MNGNPIGVSNKITLLDTVRYNVEYTNSDIEVLQANTIAENLLA